MCNISSVLCVVAMGIRVLYPMIAAIKSVHSRRLVPLKPYNGSSPGVRGQGVARACSTRCVGWESPEMN